METSNEPGFPAKKSIEELMNVILANEGDYIFILSLSGKIVKETSSKPELRKAYLLLSTKVFILKLIYYEKVTTFLKNDQLWILQIRIPA